MPNGCITRPSASSHAQAHAQEDNPRPHDRHRVPKGGKISERRDRNLPFRCEATRAYEILRYVITTRIGTCRAPILGRVTSKRPASVMPQCGQRPSASTS